MNFFFLRMAALVVFGFFSIIYPFHALASPAIMSATQPTTRPTTDVNANGPLKDAIRNDDVARVRQLIKLGMDVNAGDDSPLTTAMKTGNIEIAKMLIDGGARVDSTNHWGCSALLCAVWTERPEMVKFLLDHGAKKDIDEGLSVAATSHHGNIAIMKLLINSGANPNAGDMNGDTPLHRIAMRSGTAEAAGLLIEAGADVNAKDHQGETPIDLAKRSKRQDILDLLSKADATKATKR